MAKHYVTFVLPKHRYEIGNADVTIEVWRNDNKYGTITISKGAVEWLPVPDKKPYKLGWRGFNEAILQYFEK